jgi:nitrite reductase/ring-hydroxylating ferredoxin subunit
MPGRAQTHDAPAESLVLAASMAELERDGRLVTHVGGHTIVLISHVGRVYAVDNRCPHMGFPLHRGTCDSGILTCHWHHARFDLETGGTFDPWADDVRTFPVQLRDGEIWIDTRPQVDVRSHQRGRLREGLERNLPLVIAKAVIALADEPVEALRIGLDHGARHRRAGWGQGLTILACMANLLPRLEPEDRQRALYHGLSAVAVESAGDAPRFPLRPLPGSTADAATCKRWFRRFVEVRDAEGAERCLVSAVHARLSYEELADVVFAAATDHRFIAGGHALDFANKAFEALDVAGWDLAETVLPSLAPVLADAARMEEANAWRHPVDLVAILDAAFEELADIDAAPSASTMLVEGPLAEVLLGDDAQAIADALLEELRRGGPPADVAQAVSYAAALRIARFPTSNEFGDWDTALHTFTFANAIEQGLRRAPSRELIRGVFDAAMSVYLDRFLNVPATRLPDQGSNGRNAHPLLEALLPLLDRQQQVDEAASLAARYLAAGGEDGAFVARLGRALLREDRDFHTIQTVEAAARQYDRLRATAEGRTVLVAAARYLAAHAPTVRSQEQTFSIAARLHRGERLYDDET